MSDTYYGLECLVRERARAIDGEVQRRQLLRQACGRPPRWSFAKHSKGGVKGMLRILRFPGGRAESAVGCCDSAGCRS